MSEHKVIYDRNRFPKQPAKGLCRGCHEPVPKGRQTWCSDACQRIYLPVFVNRAVRIRDKGICSECHRKISEIAREWISENPEPVWNPDWRYNTHKEQVEKFWKDGKRWEAMVPKEEIDHIMPFSEGGKTVLENLRTLCSSCHLKRSSQQTRDRAARARFLKSKTPTDPFQSDQI